MKPYIPQKLPFYNLNWTDFISLIGKANAEVARFDGLLQSMPDPTILLSPLSTQEAVLSSKIEGTQATLEEVLEFEANPAKANEKYQDIREILNYRQAMTYAVGELERLPFCLRLIREIHKCLMDDTRGQNRNPGNFRTEQNWIGKPGTPIEQASYVPPSPNLLADLLTNLETYINSNDKDHIVQLAMIHAQFELIHPFLDGNGRIGRMLMPLFLYHKKVLSSPMFYLSAYFESDRDLYYQRLRNISLHGDWAGWIQYFLQAVIAQSRANIEKAKKIHNLYNQKKAKISEITRSRYSIKVLDFLFCMPIFKSHDFIRETGIPKSSAKRILSQLVDKDVLDSLAKVRYGRSGNIYLFQKLLTIID